MMGRGKLTSEEIAVICENPNIKGVGKGRILYTKDFKRHFMREYLETGKGPTQIFREAGFDTDLLGPKRIERAAAHWREAYSAGRLVLDSDSPEVPHKKSHAAQLEALREENKLLKEQIELLSRMQSLQVK